MINEIITYRRQGMSFRKIAEKLNSTVGKVHYQWVKNVKEDQVGLSEPLQHSVDVSNEKSSADEYLVAKLVAGTKIASFWRIADWQKELVSAYFNMDVSQRPLVLRIYDVTDIIFNGSNAHDYFEFYIPENKTYWVIKGIQANRNYLTEIGYRLNDQRFFPILRSNTIKGQTQKDLYSVLENETLNRAIPNWTEKVSTYSYYENINGEKRENE
jgi:uncharacterized protein